MIKKSTAEIFLRLLLLVSFLLTSSSCGGGFRKPDMETLNRLGFRSIPESREFPEIRFRDLNGKEKTLKDFEGNVILLNFWATWCPPCRAEMPGMENLARELKGRDFIMVPISVQETSDTVKSYMEESGIDFPVYLDEEARAAMSVGVTGLPTSILIDRDGTALGAAVGSVKWDSAPMISMMKDWTR